MTNLNVTSASASPSPEWGTTSVDPTRQHLTRRVVGIVSNKLATVPQNLQVGGLGLDMDAYIIINEGGCVGNGGVEVSVSVEDGIVSLKQNNNFAMGTPSGTIGEAWTPRVLDQAEHHHHSCARCYPCVIVVSFPIMTTTGTAQVEPTQYCRGLERGHQRNATICVHPVLGADGAGGMAGRNPVEPATPLAMNVTPTNTLGGRTMSNSP